MELLNYSLELILFGTLLTLLVLFYLIHSRVFTHTEKRAHLIRERVLIFLGLFSGRFDLCLSIFRKFISHITPLNLSFTLIIAAPIYTWSSEYFSTINYIECKSGYAIEVRPGKFVSCSAIDIYWDHEYEGRILTSLEMSDPSNPNPIKTKEIK